MENGPFIGDLPIQLLIFHSYVSLLERRAVAGWSNFQEQMKLSRGFTVSHQFSNSERKCPFLQGNHVDMDADVWRICSSNQ